MPYQRLSESIQTLYAELLEKTIHAEAETARLAADDAQRANLVSVLAAAGAAKGSSSITKALLLLAESGVFLRGAILVGTPAFIAYGNMLGVRFEMRSLRTPDVDILQDRAIEISRDHEGTTDLRRFLMDSGFEPNRPGTSFKMRGRSLWVDFVTPSIGQECTAPVFLPALGVAAHPIWFLDYLIENPVQAVVIGGLGILVNVPDPTRFALHKLFISEGRSASEQAEKDRRQAGDLLEVLIEDRPRDFERAWEALARNAFVTETVRTAISRLPPDLHDRLERQLD